MSYSFISEWNWIRHKLRAIFFNAMQWLSFCEKEWEDDELKNDQN